MASPPPLEYVDVQPLLDRVCGGLAPGELLAAEGFSLHDAMTAIEIGDLKMDFGHRTEEVASAEELIAAGQAPTELPVPQLLALLDRLLAMEATWHTGSMLPLTVFTSLYMLDTDRLEGSVVLQSYCVAMRSACTLVHELIIGGQVCEDEDILVHAFGLRLDLPGAKAIHAAQAALQRAEGSVQQDSGLGALGPALLARLRFRLLLLRVLERCSQPSQRDVQEMAALCNDACTQLTLIQQTAPGEDELAAAPGFVPAINKRHMGLVPPRKGTVMTLSAAVEHWRTTLEGIALSCRSLLGCTNWRGLSEVLVQFAARPNQPIVRTVMHHLVAKPLQPRGPAAAALATPAAGGVHPEALATGDASNNSNTQLDAERAAPRWCPSQHMIAAEFGLHAGVVPEGDTRLFLEQCSIAALGWCHAMCVNRCRQRRRLRRLLEDWRNMSDHACNAEATPELQAALMQQGWKWTPTDEHGLMLAGPVTAWVEVQAARTMLGHLMLGCPLELYHPAELCCIYWYCDYLLNAAQVASLELQDMRPPAAPAPGRQAKGAGKGKIAAKKKAVAEEQARQEQQREEALAVQVDRLMCQGVTKMAAGLEALGLIKPPADTFSTFARRFQQRFGSFAQVTRPEPLRAQDFRDALEGSTVPSEQWLLLAFESFAKAESAAAAAMQAASLQSPAQAKHLAGVKRIAAQNKMALKLLATSLHAQAKGSNGGPAAATFKVLWDLKVALQHSTSMFYPCLMLKSAANPK